MHIVLLVLLAFGGLTTIGVLGMYGLTLVGRSRSTPTSAELSRRLDEINERLTDAEADLAQLSRTDQQILELEERVEFTERLLQQFRDRDRLPPGE